MMAQTLQLVSLARISLVENSGNFPSDVGHRNQQRKTLLAYRIGYVMSYAIESNQGTKWIISDLVRFAGCVYTRGIRSLAPIGGFDCT